MDSKYFFQLGVPNRNHPLTPAGTIRLTKAFAKTCATALDEIGSLYFTEERFDDFYMGKGSTYPDLHGAVGILFEQASSRGQLQHSSNGTLSLPFTIRNQFVTSVSSLRTAMEKRGQLLDHQQTFYRDARAMARTGNVRGYVVAARHDPTRLSRFLEVLDRHDIHSYRLAQPITIGDHFFCEGDDYVIPCDQAEFRFLQSLFECRTAFADSTFYDVSAWTLPLAFNLSMGEITDDELQPLLGEPFERERLAPLPPPLDPDALAYLIDWRAYLAPRTLYRLLAARAVVRVATKPLVVRHEGKERPFGYGALLVPMGIQSHRRATILRILRLAGQDRVPVCPIHTGLTPDGPDVGSNQFLNLPRPRVLLVTGRGVSVSEAGEVWHLLDRRLAMPVTKIETDRLSDASLRHYTVVVVPGSKDDAIADPGIKSLTNYVEGGGTLIAMGTSAEWVQKTIADVAPRNALAGLATEHNQPTRRPYKTASQDASECLIRGAIFRARVDATHPIGYGYELNATIPVFRTNSVFLNVAKNPYSSPVMYDTDPLLSGYISQDNLQRLSGSASVVVHQRGKGRVIVMVDNPNFRAFWYGTNRLFLNSLFFAPIIRVP